jgi:hypothetical protein
LTDKKTRFPIAPLLTIAIGFIGIGIVFFASLLLVFFPVEPVHDAEEANVLAERYALGIGKDFKVKEITGSPITFMLLSKNKGTGVYAFELLFDRYTGRVSPEPGPNMIELPNAYGPELKRDIEKYKGQWALLASQMG